MADHSDLLQPHIQPPASVKTQATIDPPIPGDHSDLLQPRPQRISDTGQTIEPLPLWQQGFAAFNDRLTSGGAALNKIGAGFILASGGSLDDARKDVESMALQEATQHRQDFINKHAYMTMFKLKDLPWEEKEDPEVFSIADLPGMLVEQIPQLGVIGAGIGTGAVTGSVFGPAGVGVGALAGGAVTTGAMIFGSHVYDQMDRGVPKDHAVLGGVISGAIGGVATTIGLGKLGELMPNAAQIVFRNGGVQKSIRELAAMLGKGVGIDVAGGFFQSAVDAGIKAAETSLTKTAKPYTMAETLTEIAGGTAQSLVSAPLIGATTTVTGIVAGRKAIKAHAEMTNAMEAFTARMAQMQAAFEQAELADKAQREAETAERTKERQIKARRTLKGFVDVDITLPIEEAQKNFDAAQADHDTNKNAVTGAALNQAKAELQHAKYASKLAAIEDALSDPNLEETIAEKQAELEGRIEALETAKTTTMLPSERAVFSKSISEHKAALKELTDFKNLASSDQIRHIETVKEQLQGFVDKARLDVARAALTHRIEGRAAQIEQIQEDIQDLKVEPSEKTTDEVARIRKEIDALKQQESLEDEKKMELVGIKYDMHVDELLLELVEGEALSPSELSNLANVPKAHLKDIVDRAQKQGKIVKRRDKKPFKKSLEDSVKQKAAIKELKGRIAEYEREAAKVSREIEQEKTNEEKRAKHIVKLEERITKVEDKAYAQNKEKEAALLVAKRESLEQLHEQQELDKFVLEMLDAGELEGSDIRDLSPKTPAVRLQGLATLAKRKVEQAAKFSGKKQAKLLASAKKILDRVIDHSRLSQADKNALKAQYATVDLQTLSEKLPGLEARIEELFQKRKREAARRDLKRELNSMAVDPKVASKYPETEEHLLSIKKFAEDPEAVEHFLEVMDNKEKPTEQDLAKLELTKLFPDSIDKLSSAELEKILDALVELKEKGETEALRRHNERKARQQGKLNRLNEAMQPSQGGQARLDKRQQKQGIKRTLDKLLNDTLPAEIKSWRGLMIMITQFGDATELTDILDIKSALSEMHKIRIQWENRWQKMLEAKGMTKGQQDKFSMNAEREITKDLTYRSVELLEDGTQIEVTRKLEQPNGDRFTLWELMQIRNYLLDEDPNAISRLKHGNGFSYPNEVLPGYSTLEVIERHLDGSLKDWRTVADTMREFYSKDEFGAVVNEAIEKRFGRSMPNNPTYGGELLGSNPDGSGRFREAYRRMSTRPGSMFARKGGIARVEIRSAADNLKNHIAQYAREHAMWEIEADAQFLFDDQNVKDNIERNIGENTYKVIKKYIEDIILGQQHSYNAVDKLFSSLRKNVYSRFLGARPEQFAKQLTGSVHALQFVSPRAMLDGYAYLLSNPDEAIALMNESGLLQARKLARDPDFKPDIASRLDRLNNSLMASVEVGDHYSVYGSSFPVLLETLRQTGDKGKALKAFETAFDTTQSSSSVDEMPSLLRGHPATRLFTIMSQEPTRQVEAIHNAYLKWRAGKESWQHVARIMAVTYAGALFYNLIGYICAYPFLDDKNKQQRLEYMLKVSPLGPLSGVAIVGQALSSTSVSLFNIVLNQKTKAYEPELLATDPLSDIGNFLHKLETMSHDGGDAEDWWDALILASNVLGDVIGLPTTNILKKAEPFIGVKNK